MSRLAKLQSRKEWRRRIWQTLVEFANSRSDEGRTNSQQKDFREMLVECMNWLGGDGDDIKQCREMREARSVRELASYYQTDIRQVLVWLSAPDQQREIAHRAGKFLELYGTGIRMSIDANRTFKEEAGEPLLYKWPALPLSVIAPVCKFILDQIELHDTSEETFSEAVPIRLCRRVGCGKLFTLKRARRRQFCGPKCRSHAYQSRLPRKQKADKMRKYRGALKERDRKNLERSKKR